MKNDNLNRLGLSVLSLSLFAVLTAQAAPLPPDAGQTIRETQQQPNLAGPKVAAPVIIEEASSKSGGSDNTRISVTSVRVTGNTVIESAELEVLVASLAGGERTFGEIKAAAARITALYRERGYTLARAYLPAQEVKSGVVVIQVLEGRIDKTSVKNDSRLADANAYLGDIKKGDVVKGYAVERALLLLNDTPGVGAARATVQPGASVGTSDLLVELSPAAPVSGSVEVDNYGNRYTGENRLGGSIGLNSPFGIGDQLTLRALTTDKSMTYARLAYMLPIGSSGLKLGAAYSSSNYGQLAKEFASLQAHGKADSSSLYATYPFVRSLENNLSGTASWENKKLSDYTNVPVTSASKRIQVASIGLAGSHQNIGHRATAFEITVASGKLNMDAASLAVDNASARSSGTYNRLAYGVNHQERLTDTDALVLAVSGQQASKNLNSSEKFSLGGANGVRAYPQGEGIGDQGWLANLEARHNFAQGLQGVLFYDAGSVTINKNPFTVGAANSRSISGAGVGANANYAGMQFRAFVAWRTGGGQPTSEPATLKRNPRVWIQASKQF